VNKKSGEISISYIYCTKVAVPSPGAPYKMERPDFLILWLKLCTIEFWIITTQWGKKKRNLVFLFYGSNMSVNEVQKWVFEECGWVH
jgi:hypothetical protein